MSVNSRPGYVGKSTLRREDEYLLRGKGQFLDDLPEPRDVLHASFVLSPHAHARIANIDCSAALALDGVVAVLSGNDIAPLVRPMIPKLIDGYINSLRDVIARDKVRFVGEYVAVVLAEHPYIAHDAAELVEVEYEALPAVAQIEQALADDAPLVHEHIKGNVSFHSEFSTGDVDGAFSGDVLTLKKTFRTGWAGGVARWSPAAASLCRSTSATRSRSTPRRKYRTSSAAVSLAMWKSPESLLRVVVPEVGGGFGTKANVYPEEIVTVAYGAEIPACGEVVQDHRELSTTSTRATTSITSMSRSRDKASLPGSSSNCSPTAAPIRASRSAARLRRPAVPA